MGNNLISPIYVRACVCVHATLLFAEGSASPYPNDWDKQMHGLTDLFQNIR